MLIGKGFGTKKTLTITDSANPRYTVVSPAETLQTSEPTSGTGYIEYTVLQDDLPTFSNPPTSVKYDCFLLAWGGGGSGKTLNWKAYYNGSQVSMATTTYATTKAYWTTMMNFAADSNPVGKSAKIALWETTGALNIMGYALLVYPTMLQLESGHLLYDFSWGNLVMPSPLAGVSGINQQGTNDSYIRYDEFNTGYTQAVYNKKVVNSDPYSFTHYAADQTMVNKMAALGHDTNYPYYTHPQYPHTFTYRVLSEGKL